MKKVLSITEFERKCREEGYTSYLYSSSYQPSTGDTDGRIAYSYMFTNVCTSLQPNTVLFTCKNGRLRFSRIKRIEYFVSNDGASVFKIICGDRSSAADESEYLLRPLK